MDLITILPYLLVGFAFGALGSNLLMFRYMKSLKHRSNKKEKNYRKHIVEVSQEQDRLNSIILEQHREVTALQKQLKSAEANVQKFQRLY